MDELSSGIERRRALRVPVRGEAVLHADDGRCHATLENLSHGGVLLSLPSRPRVGDRDVDVELRMLGGGGWISGRARRVEREAKRWWVAVEFDTLEPGMRARIEAAIDAALATIRSRPILVIDDRKERRTKLMATLTERGLTPLTPRTPLEAIDYLTRTQMHVDVCMLGNGFDLKTQEIAAVLADSFPWVNTQEIDDDLEATAARAFEAWTASPVARIATAIG